MCIKWQMFYTHLGVSLEMKDLYIKIAVLNRTSFKATRLARGPRGYKVVEYTGLNTISICFWHRRTSYLGSTRPAKLLMVLQILLNKKKHGIKFIDNIYFYLSYLHLFQKHLMTFLRGNLVLHVPKCLFAL